MTNENVNTIVETGNEVVEAVETVGSGIGKKVAVVGLAMAAGAGIAVLTAKVVKKVKAKKEAKRIEKAKEVEEVVVETEEKTEDEAE